MQAKVQYSITKTKHQIEKVRGILDRLQQPKKVYELFDVEVKMSGYIAIYHDQFGKEYTNIIPQKTLTEFIDGFYSAVVDSERGGEHEQYIDHTPAAVYLIDNINEVITDYLNNSKI